MIMKVVIQSVLKREMKNRLLTINKLARQCDIPASVLHGWVHGVLPSAKNLHHVATLAEYLHIPLSELLFDWDESKTNAKVLFESEFAAGDVHYRLLVEKIGRGRK